MNDVQTKCASSLCSETTSSVAASPTSWENIDWDRSERNLRKLQIRIAKAQQAERYGKVKALQRLLTTSFEAKALAVKRVTSNRGKRTAGVDHIKWLNAKQKWEAIGTLKRRGYESKPLKRVYIAKSNGKKRPLGIPTMKDRAMQALYFMALEPVTETNGDAHSFGFRRKRRAADAIEYLHLWLSRKVSAEWVLEGDIKGCFDHISHQWLLANVQTDKTILKKWLKSGVIFNKQLSPTEEGTPQGGIISPALANVTLDGMERLLTEKYPTLLRKKGKTISSKIHLVRYADDFVVTGKDRETLEEIKDLLTVFLAERGLTLSEEKTVITHISQGFDFLGFNVRKYKGKLLIKPSKKGQQQLTRKLHETIFSNKMESQHKLIELLNPILRGWGNYYRHVVSKKVFSRMDYVLFMQLKRWCYRRHNSRKTRKQILKKYFHTDAEGKSWTFCHKSKEKAQPYEHVLKRLTDIPIRRYIVLREDANPFDTEWDEYFARRSNPQNRRRAG